MCAPHAGACAYVLAFLCVTCRRRAVRAFLAAFAAFFCCLFDAVSRGETVDSLNVTTFRQSYTNQVLRFSDPANPKVFTLQHFLEYTEVATLLRSKKLQQAEACDMWFHATAGSQTGDVGSFMRACEVLDDTFEWVHPNAA